MHTCNYKSKLGPLGHSCQDPEETEVFTENLKLHTVFTQQKSVYLYAYSYAL